MKRINRIDIDKAIQVAKKYCVDKGYNADKIDSLYMQTISEKLCIARFPDIKANGLMNDIETRAIPVLIVNSDYTVTEWEGADKVLQ